MRLRRWTAGLLATPLLLIGVPGAAASTGDAPAAGNPVELTDGFYADPESNPAKWVRDHPDDERAETIKTKIAQQPGALWFGDWNTDVGKDVGEYVGNADAANKLPILVAYNMVKRDCSGESGGGAPDAATYRTWISDFAKALGDKPAVVIVEPDALPQLDCLNEADRKTRVELLTFALDELAKAKNTWAYVDAGNSSWIKADEMAARLNQIGVSDGRGFALNVSNFKTTDDSIAYAGAVNKALSEKFGYTTKFTVDTSRNGNGPPPESEDDWCNPPGRKLGTPSQVGGGADLLLWIKVPGDSDGDCGAGAGIPAGTFSPDLAMGLINGT